MGCQKNIYTTLKNDKHSKTETKRETINKIKKFDKIQQQKNYHKTLKKLFLFFSFFF